MSLRLPSFSASNSRVFSREWARDKLLPASFWLFLFSLPLGTRKLLWQFMSGFDEYETVFLYASDFFLVAFLFLFFLTNGFGGLGRKIGGNFLAGSLFFLILFSAFSVVPADYSLLAFIGAVRLLLAAIAALAIAALLRGGIVKFKHVALALAALAVIQSLVGFGQFAVQGGVGLKFFGEPEIGPLVGGASKILAGGGKLLRAYGTFPHPNVFAAFLLPGLFSLFYLWIKRPAHPFLWNGWRYLLKEIFLGTGVFAVILGLLLSFSRAAWVAGVLLAPLVIGYSLATKEFRNQAVRLLILLSAILCALFFALGFAIFPRAHVSSGEQAVVYRLAYNELGLEIIKDNLLGVGIGNQVIYAVKNGLYQKLGMTKRWQWQPVHNIYLLMAAEIGVLGLLAFLLFFGRLLIFPFFAGYNLPLLVPAAMLLGLLLLGFFDHFLWTLQPGRLMLWTAVGLLLSASTARPRS